MYGMWIITLRVCACVRNIYIYIYKPLLHGANGRWKLYRGRASRDIQKWASRIIAQSPKRLSILSPRDKRLVFAVLDFAFMGWAGVRLYNNEESGQWQVAHSVFLGFSKQWETARQLVCLRRSLRQMLSYELCFVMDGVVSPSGQQNWT